MSALRWRQPDGSVVLLDPYTREPYQPCPIGSEPSGPVEIVCPGTGKAAPKPVKPGTFVLVSRQVKGTYIAHLTDDEVLGAVATTATQVEAAELLHVSQSSLCRRLAQIKAGLQ